MDKVLNSINWFEIPANDFDRAKNFYSKIFDYEMTDMQMGDTRMGFLPHDQGTGVGGAICFGPYYTVSKEGPKVYLNGNPDLNVVLNRVESAGGKIIVPKEHIPPDFGYFAKFEDTEGNHIYLHSMS
jgi:predicted enzyme related to lactoylglutathione lyase